MIKWAIGGMLAIIAALFTMPATPAMAVDSIEFPVAHAYDTPAYDQATHHAALERGPPDALELVGVLAADRAVDPGSYGTSVRPGSSATAHAYPTYDRSVSLAKADESMPTTTGNLQEIDADLSAIPLALVAVKTASAGWKVGDDVYAATKAGNSPAWSTVRSRFWKNSAADSKTAGQWDEGNLARMQSGRAPQRFNPDKGGLESMELSHEPIPFRNGGRDFVPRWPQDHAAVDPFRFPGY